MSSLSDFLQFVDEEFNFTSFADLLPVCAKDILSGLNYLHNHNIAHRDLKPSNTLVCNQHLNIIPRNDQAAMEKAFGECPIVCRLTDFGLSCSVDVQTKSIMASQTTAIGCGTPAYMAPEMQLNQLVSASQDDLKRADVWSLGLVMHNMVNSDIGSPYRVELEKFGISDTNAALKDLLKKLKVNCLNTVRNMSCYGLLRGGKLKIYSTSVPNLMLRRDLQQQNYFPLLTRVWSTFFVVFLCQSVKVLLWRSVLLN